MPKDPLDPPDEADPPHDPALGLLALAILDGTDVDWLAVGSGPVPADDAMLRQFRVLADVVALHRSLPPAGAGPSAGTSSATTPDRLGQWGPLTILERIGEGAFGEVFRALDTRLDREVALKLLRPSARPRSAREDLVIDEARLLARVRHPNVVTVHGAECIEGRVGIWTEFIEGSTVEAWLAERGRLAPGEAAAIGSDICRALAAVHEAGLVHRDIKAQNVMREVGGRIVLMDFGTVHDAALVPANTAALAGTPLYMAPELFAGGPPSVASDVYAVGVLLFRMVTGKYPVSGTTAEAIKAAHAAGQRTSLKALPVDVPQRMVSAIERALAADPAARFARAEEFAEALKDTRRVPSLTWLVAAGIAAIGAGIGLWRWSLAKTADDVPARLCRNCVVQDYTSISRDGRIAIVPDDDSGDLVLRTLGTQTDRRVFAKPGTWSDSKDYAEFPVLSPDARLMAFRWIMRNPERAELRIMPARARSPSIVVLPASAATWSQPVDWRPDGTAVLVTVQRGNAWALAWVTVPDGTITIVRSFGLSRGNPILIARVSPDGRHIVYGAAPDANGSSVGRPATGEAHLFLMNADGTNHRALVTTAAANTGPVWTADGSHVIFTSNVSGSGDLWSVPAGEAAPESPVLVRKNIGQNIGLTLTPEGRYIYAVVLSPLELSFISSAPGAIRAGVPAPIETVPGIDPHWSADGEQIALLRTGAAAGRALVVRTLKDGRERTYSRGDLRRAQPIWTRSGAILVEAGPGGQPWSMFRVNLETGQFQELLAPSSGTVRTAVAALSPDDSTLYVGARDSTDVDGRSNRIVAIDLTSKQERPVVALPGWRALVGGGYLGLTVSPSGGLLAMYLVNAATHEGYVQVADIAARTVRNLVGPFPAHAAFGKIAWTRDNLIWFAEPATDAADRQGWRIVRVPATGGVPAIVIPFINGPLVGEARFSASPDGTRVAWSPAPGYPQTASDLAGPRNEVWAIDLRKALEGRQ